eukprot:SAG11_NODE_936_length_6480_cov_18.654600_1_plen_118_part_00
MYTVLYLPACTFDPVKDPQSPHNRNLLVVQPVRKQRVSWICRPSNLVLVMVLVTTLVTTDDGSVSCDLIRPSRSSPPRMPQRLWGTRMEPGGHICVDSSIGFSHIKYADYIHHGIYN